MTTSSSPPSWPSPRLTTLKPPAFLLGPGLFVVAACTVLGLARLPRLRRQRPRRPGEGDRARHARPDRLVAALGAATGVGLDRRDRRRRRRRGHRDRRRLRPDRRRACWAGRDGSSFRSWCSIMPLAVVSAADIDLRGGVGERTYRPAHRRRPAPRVQARRRPDGPRPAPDGPAGQTRAGQRPAGHRRGAAARPERHVRHDRRADRRRRRGHPRARRPGLRHQPRHRRSRVHAPACTSTPTSASATCRSTTRARLRVKRRPCRPHPDRRRPGDDRARHAAAARPHRVDRCPLRLHGPGGAGRDRRRPRRGGSFSE